MNEPSEYPTTSDISALIRESKNYKKRPKKEKQENIFLTLLDCVAEIMLVVGFFISVTIIFLPMLWKQKRVGEFE